MKGCVITIDGPAGAGKTTVSCALARRLSYAYIDTGALYRGVAYEALESGIAADDDAALESLCSSLSLAFSRDDRGEMHLISNSVDITNLIRTPRISMFASAVSSRAVVRHFLLGLQRALGRGKSVVCEGRDMGTVVFPDAEVKFFLDADPGTRAVRRYRESACQATSLEDVARDMKRRDERDSNRALAPLAPAEDAIRIDATHISAETVVERMLAHVHQRSSS